MRLPRRGGAAADGYLPEAEEVMQHAARTYPLTGILFCAARRSPLRGVSSNGGESRYYVDKLCQQREAREDRHQKNVKADAIEGTVREIAAGMALPPGWRDRILAYVVYDDGMEALERDRYAVRERPQRARELYQAEDYTRLQYERVKAQCQRDLEALTPATTALGQEVIALLDDLPSLWEALTEEELKSLYRLMFSAIYVQDQAIVEIEPRGAFRDLLGAAAACQN